MKNDSKFLFGIVTAVLALIIICLGFVALSPNTQFAQVFSSQRNSTEIKNLNQQVKLLQSQVQEITFNQALSDLNETLPLLVSEFHEIFSSEEPNVPTTTPTTPPDRIRYPTVEVTTDPVTKIKTIKRCVAANNCQIITIHPDGQIVLSHPSIPFVIRIVCDEAGDCVVKLNIPGEPTICTVRKITMDDGEMYYEVDCDFDPIGPNNRFKKEYKVYINKDGELCLQIRVPAPGLGDGAWYPGDETCHDLDKRLIPHIVTMFPNLAPRPEKPVIVTPVGESPEVPKTPRVPVVY